MTAQDFDNFPSSDERERERLIDEIIACEPVPELKEYEAPKSQEEAFQPPRKKKKKKKKRKNFLGIFLALFIVIVAFSLSGIIIYLGMDLLAVNKPDEKLIVEIPSNATVTDIAEILKSEGVIKQPLLFRLVSKLEKADGYIAGKHEINKNMPYTAIIDTLQSDAINERVEVQVTIPEGKNLYEAAVILENNGVCSKDAFLQAFNYGEYDFDFLSKIKNTDEKFYPREGYLFPDTYRFFKDSEPEAVAIKFFTNFEEKMSDDIIKKMKAQGLSMDEAITLASIIQMEASGTAEMNNVSSVFHNRLDHSKTYPLLQSDPTSKYVREVIRPNLSWRKLSEEDGEKLCNAYDTYVGEGLPPGAICNPGIDAIKAAVSPNITDYYFFCSDLDTREFYYAKTNKEHESNLVKAGLK